MQTCSICQAKVPDEETLCPKCGATYGYTEDGDSGRGMSLFGMALVATLSVISFNLFITPMLLVLVYFLYLNYKETYKQKTWWKKR